MKNIKNLNRNAVLFLLILSSFLLYTPVISQESNLKLDLEYGKHAVGFISLNQYDHSRTYNPGKDVLGNQIKGEGFRPVQTLIWYPAEKDKEAENFLYEYYIYNFTNIENYIPITESLKAQIREYLLKDSDFKGDFAGELALRTRAYKDAKPKKGNFPIIVYAPSWSHYAWQNSDMCEYLASHGYIVAASPSFNKNSREMSSDIESLDAQAKDIEFLVNYMKDFPNSDFSKTAILGYSWGATSNIIAAERLKHIDALICLDGAIEHRYNKYSKETPYLDPLKLNIPFLAMSLKKPSEEKIREDNWDSSFIFYESLKHSAAYRIRFLKMKHSFFGGAYLRTSKPASESIRKEKIYCFNLACHYTLNFFNAYIKGDRESEKWLKKTPKELNIPEGFLSIESKNVVKK
ncbi:dienelactone hydrolase family protein [candidate division KSB1 bacterium]